jgi:tetratricopeptide (TPR) repeat protein
LRKIILLLATVILFVSVFPAYAWDEKKYDYGIQYINETKYRASISFFTEYIKRNPDDPWGYFYRGDTYRRYKRFRFALIDFDKGIKMAPTFVNARKGSELARRGVTDAPRMERPDREYKSILPPQSK